MRQLKIALVLAAVVLSGCGVWNDLFGSKQSASMQPVCSRAALEVIIARAGMACSDTNPCPSGSYCNAGAVCAWSCYSDSECATGQFCGCDGRCTGSSSGADGGTSTTNLSCNKDATLLYKIKPGSSPVNIPSDACDSTGHCPLGAQCDTTSNTCNWVRACDNDERCPAGSYCDPATGNCGWDCQPNVACPDAAQTCDCTGRCVVPGTTPTMGQSACQPRQTVTMGVAPRTSFLAGDPAVANSWTRTVALTLSASDPSFLVGRIGLQPVTQTYVVPRDNLQVLCNGAFTSSPCPLPRNGGPPGSTDSWDIETLTPTPGSMMARATIQLKFQGTPGVVASRWHADIFTPGAGNSPQEVSFAFTTETQDISASQPAPDWQTGTLPNGTFYRGTMILTGSTDQGLNAPNTSPEAATPINVPVFAQALGTQLAIFDPSHTVSSSGTLVIQNGDAPPYYVAKISDARLGLEVHGLPSASILIDPASKAIRGQFSVSSFNIDDVNVFTGTFSLTPLAPGDTPPQIPTEPATAPSEPGFLANRLWQNQYFIDYSNVIEAAALVSSTWMKGDLYSDARGVASQVHLTKPPLLGADLGLGIYAPNAGQQACATAFLNGGYIPALKATWSIAGHTYRNDVTVPVDDTVSFCQSPRWYSTQDIKDRYLPCVDGVDQEERPRAQSSFAMTAGCQGVYNNLQYTSGGVLPFSGDYQTWLAQSCIKIVMDGFETLDVRLIDLANNGVAQQYSHPIYICPAFKLSYIRIPQLGSPAAAIASDPSPGDAAFCYDPTRAGSAILSSGYLTDGADAANTLEFSGDLLCRDDNGGTYAPKIFPLLEHADRVDRGENFPSSADSASDLFDACLSELRAPSPPITAADLSSTGIVQTVVDMFPEAACISVPRFTAALQGLQRYGACFMQPFCRMTIREEKLLTHILKQWVELHSFVAYQGLQESKLRQVLASATTATTAPVTVGGDNPGALPPIRFEDLLDLLNQSWEPLLSEYNYNRRDLIDVAHSPDYRDWSGSNNVYNLYPDRQAHQDEWLPLGVVMIEGLNQQLRLLAAYLEQAALATYSPNPTAANAARDQALVRYGTTMRLAYLVEAVAQNLFDTGQPATVQDRWNIAIGEMHGLREDARRAANDLGGGKNPLGIAEDDLPIFFGDPQGTNSQYFASSDYLVNQWATPAVAAAGSSINAARDAWLQARNSKIQDRMTQTQRDQRVDDLKSAQGQKIVDNCGLTGIDSGDVLDAFEGGTPDGTKLEMRTCFIDPACLPRLTLSPQDLANKVTQNEVFYALCTLNETAGYRHLPEPMATCASSGALVNGCEVVDLYGDLNSGLVPADAAQRADLVCQARLGFRAPLPTAQELIGQVDPACYTGKLGAAAMQAIAAKQDVDIARQNWDLAEQAFRLNTTYCEEVEQAEDQAAQRAMELDKTLDDLQDAKAMADQFANNADMASSMFSNISFSASFVNDFGVLQNGNEWKNKSVFLAHDMAIAQQDYDAAMRVKQANDVIRSCWHEVDKSQLAITSAYAQIARRGTDSITAVDQFRTLMNENVQALRQGTNDAKREQSRFISTVAHHYWVSEKVDKFNKDFAWAKRMTYLAMRAVEYEFQQSLPLRRTVLTAVHPDQLQDALRALQQEVGTRTINRRRPAEDSIVLSLRDDVLALPDHAADPTGERQLSPMRGLQQRLTDPRFAVNDKDGNWLGQGIPFNLGPEGALNYRCGERLWRITATVQGDALSDSQPGVSLLILKRNTFASQWCQGEGDGTRFQYGSIQPSARLFAENGTGALTSEANGFSTALLYPWFNIRRTDFYKDTYRDGASEELAGRGLYGDYILLFPRDVLEGTPNGTDACVSVQSGFPLAQVEDVLLRFDYLSVDNLADIQQ